MAALPILLVVTFRDRLIATISAARPVLESPGVLVVGSEVPNLFEAGAALLSSRSGMPDPEPHRPDVAALLRRLEAFDPEAS